MGEKGKKYRNGIQNEDIKGVGINMGHKKRMENYNKNIRKMNETTRKEDRNSAAMK